MTDIKEYIQRNASAFDSAELPEGHEGRFEAKLDALLSGAESSGREERKRRKTRLGIFSVLTTAAAAAAAVAAVIFINRPEREVDWFAGVADDPVQVYLTYSEKVSALYEEILSRDLDGRWETTVGSIAGENVAMIDQLPDELDDAAKAAIMKEYYGELLRGLDKINKIKEL